MKNHRTFNNYIFYVDVSGTVKNTSDDIYIGCVLINDYYLSALRDKFYRTFPSLHSFRKKGASIHPDKLKNIIKFFNDDRIRMSCVVLQRHVINKAAADLKKRIKSLKNIRGEVSLKSFPERLMGLAYFEALRKFARQYCKYHCYFCVETQFDIQTSFIALNKIAYVKKYHFKPSCVTRRIEHMIKFADFVASAGRKIDKFVLDTFECFEYTVYKPTMQDLDVVFSLSRREASKSKTL